MDTKLKNNKKSFVISTIVLIIIVITAIGMFSFYPKMAELGKIKANKINFYENDNLQNDLMNSTYVLYKNLLEKEQGRSISPSEIFKDTRVKTEKQYYDQGSIQYDKQEGYYYNRQIDEKIYFFERKLKGGLKNLDYFISNNDGTTEYSRSEQNIGALAKGDEITTEELEKLDSYYGYYMVIKYDEDGDLKLTKVKGADKDEVDNIFNSIRVTGDNGVIMEGPKNVVIVYGIPEKLIYDDVITSYSNYGKVAAYGDITLCYVLLVSMVIILVALIIPYKAWSKIIGLETILKIPFEILVVLIGIALSSIAMCPNLIYEYSQGLTSFIKFINDVGINTELAQTLFKAGNIAYWTALLSVIFISVIILKNILHTGIKMYFKENSLIIKVLIRIKKAINKVYKSCIEIDLSDESSKALVKILGVNFIIVGIMCCTWFFGIGISIVYTICLFLFLKKYFNDVKAKYSILLKATNTIAEGNLDVKIEEDLGLFDPFKEELVKIQDGFKKAVDEEVKSQKMKTELISNVSHDLKTPLTSIITYVDLLKGEEITDEDRKLYIDTLDRKSQRLKTLIEDLFEMSKVSSRNVQLNIMDVDIVSLMKQTQFELSDKIEASSLIFKCNFPEEKIIVPLDSQKTFRIFENLLVNIIKYSMDNSRVFVDIFTKEDDDNRKVYVTLKNMSAEEINFTSDEIVERFSRGDKSRNTEGSGLGLAIAKSFVELQGGRFNVDIDGDMFKVKIEFMIK